MRRAVAFSLLLASVLGGCVLATDFSGLSGGAAPGTPDGSARDVTSVGPGGEGGTPNDADGGARLDLGDWCKDLSPQPKQCFDFDDGNGVSGFTQQLMNGTAVVGNVASSAPGALYSRINPNQVGNAYLEIDLGRQSSTIREVFDILIGELDDYFEFSAIHFIYDDSSFCGIEPALSSGAIEVDEYCTGPGSGGDGSVLSATHPFAPLAAGPGWYTVDIRIDFGARSFTASVLRPDGKTLSLPTTPLNSRIQSGPTLALVGISYAGRANPPPSARFDNVILDYP